VEELIVWDEFPGGPGMCTPDRRDSGPDGFFRKMRTSLDLSLVYWFGDGCEFMVIPNLLCGYETSVGAFDPAGLAVRRLSEGLNLTELRSFRQVRATARSQAAAG
jgi:hypothetical protein